MRYFLQLLLLLLLLTGGIALAAGKINRKELVDRHKVLVDHADSLSSLTVGNGAFAFTADITGLQSFPNYYKSGVPLGTQSDWGWHSFLNTGNYKFESTLKNYHLNGRDVPYSVQRKEPEESRNAATYFRESVHRLQLGNIGFKIFKKDGSLATIQDLSNVRQDLDMWKGEINSRFSVEGTPVTVTTLAHPGKDGIAVNVKSALLQQGRIMVFLRFPYPVHAFSDMGVYYQDTGHTTTLSVINAGSASISHQLDTTEYFTKVQWTGKGGIKDAGHHEYLLTPDRSSGEWAFTTLFTEDGNAPSLPDFTKCMQANQQSWKQFWESGAAVDLAGSTDSRAMELERRIVLSQYLTRVQCAGNNPPQETGLTYNSWYGKPHMEMYWWHGAHYAFWGRTDLLERGMDWYFRARQGAAEIARRQGYKGVRWQKMTDNDGRESPSSVGAFLVWQQPHLIYLAEMIYRNKKDIATIRKYEELVAETAEFMASYAFYDTVRKQYNLGKGLIPAQECFNAVTTFNPTYELAYWSWGLEVAQQWRVRSGLSRKKEWDIVLRKLAPLPVENGLYLATESTPGCYAADSKYKIDHPAVLAALSTIPPANGLDIQVMQRTYDTVQRVWDWGHTWGWDFPLIAMTATRLGRPEQAIDDLFKDVTTNTYLKNGHNYQDTRLTIYLPGNGGLLSAVALMCAGYDGCRITNPGFPKNGKWKVKWEGFKPMP